uniref:F-box/kelch-repeat protein SKIP6-like n=1 Tax=Fragaria vesca subsp. vesca TaxID=101020 RepID=UPI0005C81462|nr:PREDICTED: F-box/kelch-repeat protein SKIP6-like [Fragaria vesca subsp. vesca]
MGTGESSRVGSRGGGCWLRGGCGGGRVMLKRVLTALRVVAFVGTKSMSAWQLEVALVGVAVEGGDGGRSGYACTPRFLNLKNLITLGSSIYVLGESVNNALSNNIWILDCRFHTWRSGPPMLVACEFAAAKVVDGRVYVIGGCVRDSWTGRSVGLRFDPSTGCWEAVANPVEVQGKWMHINSMIGGRVYTLANRDGVVYDPKT